MYKFLKIDSKTYKLYNSHMEERINKIIKILKKEYPEAKTSLKSNTPFQLLVSTILSAQARDDRVNKVTGSLFKDYPTVQAFADADVKDIMAAVKSINFYKNKSRNIKKLSQKLIAEYNGKLPPSIKQMVKLPGVARKTANVVLSQAFGIAEGIVIDTHVKRVAGRLGLTENTDPVKIEKDLMHLLPKKHWISFPFRLILHGRQVCRAKNPDCENCKINKYCPYYKNL
jgi:endonuclease III